MDNAGYTAITRQSGLMREMQTVANNIANMSTGGFRKEGVIFSEFISKLGADDPSLSMSTARGRMTDESQGVLTRTGSTYDFAIEGEGFFLIETPDGQALTRAGNFSAAASGELVNQDGYRLLDAGGAAVFVPPDATGVALSQDGTLSAQGQPITQIGLWRPANPGDLNRRDGVLFDLAQPPLPVDAPVIMQGFLEGANVSPMTEMARMIQVQRAYELGQGFLEREDERIRGVMNALGR